MRAPDRHFACASIGGFIYVLLLNLKIAAGCFQKTPDSENASSRTL
jgi:hypothetical protein